MDKPAETLVTLVLAFCDEPTFVVTGVFFLLRDINIPFLVNTLIAGIE